MVRRLGRCCKIWCRNEHKYMTHPARDSLNYLQNPHLCYTALLLRWLISLLHASECLWNMVAPTAWNLSSPLPWARTIIYTCILSEWFSWLTPNYIQLCCLTYPNSVFGAWQNWSHLHEFRTELALKVDWVDSCFHGARKGSVSIQIQLPSAPVMSVPFCHISERSCPSGNTVPFPCGPFKMPVASYWPPVIFWKSSWEWHGLGRWHAV